MSLIIAETREDVLKRALGSFASGVTVITFLDSAGRPCGMTASSFTSVSLDPFLVLVCVNRSARTHQDVVDSGRFGVNILDREAMEISNYCARPGGDKYLLDEWLLEDANLDGSPALTQAMAYLDCTIDSEVPAGTHSIIIGRGTGSWADGADRWGSVGLLPRSVPGTQGGRFDGDGET